MADKVFNANIVLVGQSQVVALRAENLAADPSGVDLFEGRIWINTTSDILKYYDGLAVVPIGTGVVALTVDNVTIEDIGTGSNPSIRVKALGITNAHISASAAIALSKLATDPLDRANHTGTQLAATISNFDTQVRTSTLNQMTAPTADLDINNHKLTNVSTPTAASDGANKGYVDAAAAGIDWKGSVRAATTANGTLATAFANGQAIDGVTLATGDRILLKNQTTGADNGIYTVNASGAPTRATDADTSAEVTAGMGAFVSEGTVNGNTSWVLTTDDPITLGTTALVFAQFSGPNTIIGTANRITVTGQQVDIAATYVGQTSITTLGTITTGVWTGTTIAVANGGTGATTAATARSNLSAAKVPYAADCTTSNPQTHNHNLGTEDVIVQVREKTGSKRVIECEIDTVDTNNTQLAFNLAPTTGQYRVVIMGGA